MQVLDAGQCIAHKWQSPSEWIDDGQPLAKEDLALFYIRRSTTPLPSYKIYRNYNRFRGSKVSPDKLCVKKDSKTYFEFH
jgi:hypothetical protein